MRDAENPRDIALHESSFPRVSASTPHPPSPIPFPSRYWRVRQVRHRLRPLLHLRSIPRALRAPRELRRDLRERIVARRSGRTLSARDVLTTRRDAAGRETLAALELID